MLRRFGRRPIVTLFLFLALGGTPARATEPDAEICERAIAGGARAVGVPQEVLHAISLTETGRPDGGRLRPWPWAINREGQGHWFKSRDEALRLRPGERRRRPAAASTSAASRSTTTGTATNFPSLEAMFDPDVGADLRRALPEEPLPRARQLVAAAGAYHSQTPARAGVYRARFDRILAGLGGDAADRWPPRPPPRRPPSRRRRARAAPG